MDQEWSMNKQTKHAFQCFSVIMTFTHYDSITFFGLKLFHFRILESSDNCSRPINDGGRDDGVESSIVNMIEHPV